MRMKAVRGSLLCTWVCRAGNAQTALEFAGAAASRFGADDTTTAESKLDCDAAQR